MTASTLGVFDLQVARVRRLSPAFTRITLSGERLTRFHPCGPLGPRDLRVKLIFPEPGGRIRVRPGTGRGWFPRWRAQDPSERGYLRTYTVRRVRLDGRAPEIDIDVVVHGHGDTQGPGAAWAESAAEGDPVLLLGPQDGDGLPEGIEWRPPAAADAAPVRVLLAADETAVPAVASILATLPSGYRGEAILEVPSVADVQPLRTGSQVAVTWLPRDGAPHGRLLSSRVHAVTGPAGAGGAGPAPALPEVDIDRDRLWEVGTPPAAEAGTPDDPGPQYAWVAGEAATVRELRAHLVHTCGIDRRRIAFMGYWRRGMPEPN